MDQRARRHGYIRGWVQSDEQGRYSIYTLRPASYPNSNIPAHIHVSVKEARFKYPYYIDAFEFDDDALLTKSERQQRSNRGGSGIVRVLQDGNFQVATHNIILGLNIPHYPK